MMEQQLEVGTDQRKYLLIPEVAERLKRSEAAVRWLIFDGQLKAGKLAGRRVIREFDLEAFIDAAFED